MRAALAGILLAHTWMALFAILLLMCVLSGCGVIVDAGSCLAHQYDVNRKCN